MMKPFITYELTGADLTQFSQHETKAEAEKALQQIIEDWAKSSQVDDVTSSETGQVVLPVWEAPFRRAVRKNGTQTAGLADADVFAKVIGSKHLLEFSEEQVPEWLRPNFHWIKNFVKKNGAEPISDIIKNI